MRLRKLPKISASDDLVVDHASDGNHDEAAVLHSSFSFLSAIYSGVLFFKRPAP